MGKHILAVDFDGVLHSYTSGWKGIDQIPDPPVPQALLWLFLAAQEFEVHIFSSRSAKLNGIRAMQRWLVTHMAGMFGGGEEEADEFVHTELQWPTQKPAAWLTVEDRAHRFDGDFSKITNEHIRNFKPWNRGGDRAVFFQHYKGGVYELMMTAQDEATGDRLCIYRCLRTKMVFARPEREWTEIVFRGMAQTPRFKEVE